MKRIAIALALATVASVPFAPAGAHTQRDVNATILLPTGATGLQGALGCPNAPGCFKQQVSRHVRCLYVTDPSLNQSGTTGRFGYVVTISAHEGDGNHNFSLSDTTALPAPLDFDVAFYATLGTCDGVTGPGPTPADPVSHGRLGNDSGRIPAGTRFAIVTLFGGANGSFRFRVAA